MNERIKELALQAGGHHIAYEGRPESYSFAFTDLTLKEFAELIVRECAKVAGGVHGYRHVMEHFGVEE